VIITVTRYPVAPGDAAEPRTERCAVGVDVTRQGAELVVLDAALGRSAVCLEEPHRLRDAGAPVAAGDSRAARSARCPGRDARRARRHPDEERGAGEARELGPSNSHRGILAHAVTVGIERRHLAEGRCGGRLGAALVPGVDDEHDLAQVVYLTVRASTGHEELLPTFCAKLEEP
jgi:hypothetical protein